MPELGPSDEELRVLRHLDAIDGEAEATKREVVKGWDENIRQVRGDQWRVKRNPYFLANIIKNQVRRKVASLTEVKPQFQVSATRPSLDKSSAILFNTEKAIWDRSSVHDALYRLAQWAMTVGSGFLQTIYDPWTDEVEIGFVDPRRVYLDPAVYSSAEIGRAQYIRIDSIVPLQEIWRRFPGRGQLVKADARFSSYSSGGRTRPTNLVGSLLGMLPRPYKPGQPNQTGPVPRAELKEYWLEDYTLNDQGKFLFPGGRHIIRCGNVVLTDEANRYWDGMFPLDMFEWDVDFESPWGLDEVGDLRRIQEAINRMGDSWVKNLLLGSNFRVIADVDALDPDMWDKLDNEAGLVIRKKPARQLEYLPPVPASDIVPTAIEGFIRLCDMLTGNQDARGGGPAGQSALDGLQLARQTLIRSVARRLESCLERVGQKVISRIFQFYTSDRILFQQGPSKQWISYTYERQKIMQDDDGRVRDQEERQQYWKDYRFMITPGSSLATTRIQRVMAGIQLRAATGVAPSVRRILGEADFGDPDELIKEGLEELKSMPQPPPPKGKGGRQ